METYSNLPFKTYELVEKPKDTERGLLLKQFTEEINKERQGTKWKPLTIRGLAIKLSHLSTKDLYYMKSICQDYKNRGGSFGKCLFGSIKVK